MKKIRTAFLLNYICVGLLAFFLGACETVDIEPVVRISVDSTVNNRIRENGGFARVRAVLNGKSKKDVRVSFAFGGLAQAGTDYEVASNTVTISAGQLSSYIDLRAINNSLSTGDKTITVTVTNASNAQVTSDPTVITISDDDTDTDRDGIVDSDDACPTDSGGVTYRGCPPGIGLIFNEVLYDPSNTGLEGDANRDGIYGQNQDEFVEIYNTASYNQDISGFTISKLIVASGVKEVRHIFPSGSVIPPNKALVVFGGGLPTGVFGGSVVQVCSNTSGIIMSNSGERVLLVNALGRVLATFNSDSLSDNPNESYTRNPDITSSEFMQHTVAVPGIKFSPGTKIDGSSF